MQPTAYSYLRFSSPSQAEGDSVRRQIALRDGWLARYPDVRFDTSLTLHDLGKSAYTGEHRQNPDRHALALFLKLIEAGRVRPGDYLLIENLDRLSREEVVPATHLLTGILLAGIRVVQLSPAELVLTKKSDMGHIMMAVVELSRGHSESAMKSERTLANWARKRRDARQQGTLVTRWLPAWVENYAGKLRLIPTRAVVVKRIFALAAAGYGHKRLVARLIQEGIKPFAPSDHWTTSYVNVILRDRRALGEYQPRDRYHKADGEAIPNYFPAVVSEAEFHAARAGAAERKQKPGRVSAHLNIFAGLTINALDGESYFATLRNDEGGRRHVLINFTATEGRAPCRAFPLGTFENAVLDRLREIDAHEILNGDDGPDETVALAGEKAEVEARLAVMEAELLEGDSPTGMKVVRKLEERWRDLTEQLALARHKQRHPLSETWGEAHTLLEALHAPPEPNSPEKRLRLRSALRRIVAALWLVVVPRGRDRLCAVQVWFAGEQRHRSYLILHRAPLANKWARKERKPVVSDLLRFVKREGLDLRRRAHAKELAALLAKLDLGEVAEGK